MKRILLVIFLLFFFIPFSFFIIPKINYFSYKQLTFDVIARKLQSSNDLKKTVSSFNNYIFSKSFLPPGAKVIDKDSYNDLIRGIAWCDQRSWLLGKLAGRVGIDNSMWMTRNPEGISNHTVAGIYLDGKERYVDPLIGLMIMKENGRLATFDDICKNNKLFSESPLFDGIKIYAKKYYDNFIDFWTKNIFHKNCSATKWSNPFKGMSFSRKAIYNIIHFYYKIGGDFFSNLAQDIYLLTVKDIGIVNGNFKLDIKKEFDYLYYKARNYELFFRTEKTKITYEKALNKIHLSSNGIKNENLLFFYSKFLYEIKDYDHSRLIFNQLLNTFPKSRWVLYVYYYLGEIAFFKAQPNQARFYLKKSFDGYMNNLKSKGPTGGGNRVFYIANRLLELEDRKVHE